MTNASVTYLVATCCGVFGLAFFIWLVVVPALSAYRRLWERAAVVVLSGYILAALVGLGIVAGYVVVIEWPRFF